MALTDWEIGQELISAQDALFDSMEDMEKEHPAKLLLQKLALEIGDYFNRNHFESHSFGLASNDDEPLVPKGDV